MAIASDLIWEDWDTSLVNVQRDVGLSNRDIQDALVRRYPDIKEVRRRVEARRDLKEASKRSVERAREETRRTDRTKFERAGSPLVRRIGAMADTVAQTIRPLPRKIGESLSRANRSASVTKLQEPLSRREPPSPKRERVGGSQEHCKERPESTPKKSRGRGAKKYDFIPWCDEVRKRKR